MKYQITENEENLFFRKKITQVSKVTLSILRILQCVFQGLKDLDIALKMNPSHLCSTMLKASFTKPLVSRIYTSEYVNNQIII